MMCLKPTSLDSGIGIEYLYQQTLAILQKDNPKEALSLNCSGIRFVRPESIIALITVARLWHQATGHKTYLHNIPVLVHKYLERMDVFTQCNLWIEEDEQLPEEQRFGRSANSTTLLEVLPIASDEQQNTQDILVAHKRASHILRTWFDAENDSIERLLSMMSEIASNVSHSHDQGFAVIQRYQDSGVRRDGSRIVMAISDLGIGIEASLRNKPVYASGVPLAHPITGADYILHAL